MYMDLIKFTLMKDIYKNHVWIMASLPNVAKSHIAIKMIGQ